MRIEGLRELSLKFSMSILSFMNKDSRESSSDNDIYVHRVRGDTNEISAYDIIFRSMLFVLGEYTKTITVKPNLPSYEAYFDLYLRNLRTWRRCTRPF